MSDSECGHVHDFSDAPPDTRPAVDERELIGVLMWLRGRDLRVTRGGAEVSIEAMRELWRVDPPRRHQ